LQAGPLPFLPQSSLTEPATARFRPGPSKRFGFQAPLTVVKPLPAHSSSRVITIDGRTLAALLEGVARVQRDRAKNIAKKSREHALSAIESMPSQSA